MKITPSGINFYTFIKLPSAWWCGIRIIKITDEECQARVRLKWFNQNPFKSMFWAVQGMAAELATGVLIMQASKLSQSNISMLVINNKANFTKKARGMIIFSCTPNHLIKDTFSKLVETKEPQTIWLQAQGRDSQGDVVSTFEFECTLLLKK